MFEPGLELELPKLQTLIDNAFAGQWSPDERIDWTAAVVVPAEVPQRAYVDMVSQLYYAEEATIQLLGRMLQELPDLQARQYVCTQAIDEARHAQVYRRYLRRLGDIAPINESLRLLFETGLSSQTSILGTVAALNVLMEGEALKQQRKRIETLPCPLFRAINLAIVQDEARHAGFGRVYLKERLRTLPVEDRAAIYGWLKRLWHLWAKANADRYRVEGAEILRTEADELAARWQVQHRVFVEIGLYDEGSPAAFQ